MKVLLISGFLGAGKTSFIKAMTRATGRQFVVVENEFGNINIDSEILKNDTGNMNAANEMKIWELTEGCICCSMNMDFSLSVMTIANTLRPDYLLVEPSGVALPSRIIDGLKKISYENIEILSPITIIDALHFRTQRSDYAEYFNDQLKTAGTIVLSKSEGLNEDEFIEIERELDLVSPLLSIASPLGEVAATPPKGLVSPEGASTQQFALKREGDREGLDFPHEHYSKWPREKWFELLSRPLIMDGTNSAGNKKAAAEPVKPLENIALSGVSFSSPVELIAKLEMLISGVFGHVVRAKGFAPKIYSLKEIDEWLCFNVVDGVYEITSIAPVEHVSTRYARSDTGKMVIIGEKLEVEGLNKLFGGTFVIEDDEEE